MAVRLEHPFSTEKPIDEVYAAILDLDGGRLSFDAGADLRLVGAQHVLGVDDALRISGRAGGEQDFRNGVRTDLGMGGIDRIS